MQFTHLKLLTFNFRVALAALLCALAVATTASAQEAASSWVKVAPRHEAFTVEMPHMPFPVAERSHSGELSVTGQRYSMQHENAEYTVWSFKGAELPAAPGDDRETYLDRCAEVAWRLIIEPHRKRLEGASRDEFAKYFLAYVGNLPSNGHPGRRYLISLGEQAGITHVYAVGSQIYIVAAAAGAHHVARVKEFIKSFTLNLPLPEVPSRLPSGGGTGGVAGTGVGTGMSVGTETGGGVGAGNGGVGAAETGGGVGAGRGEGGGKAEEIEYNRTFAAREVTRKAQILSKPEPSYTEWARRFYVTGTVRMRLILRPNGEVGNITPIARLPHGLTQEAIKAARKISFTPAEKDGRKVSQYVTFEYNFNIY